MTLRTKHPFRLAAFPVLFSLVAALSACGGNASGGATTSTVAATGATVIDWHVGATNVATTVKAGATVQWRSTDGMTHTVTSSSTPSAFAELNVVGGGLSSPFVVNTPGAFPYFCAIHGARAMNGTLTVTP